MINTISFIRTTLRDFNSLEYFFNYLYTQIETINVLATGHPLLMST